MSKLKIGVFGAYRGMTMINVLLNHPDAELVAVCDKFLPALEKAGAAAKEAGISITLYESFDEFFCHDMDAVVLAVTHDEFSHFTRKDMDTFYGEGQKVLIDIKGMFDRREYENAGYLYWRL